MRKSRQDREEPKTPAPIWEQPDPSPAPSKKSGEPTPEPGADEQTITPTPGQPSSGGTKPSSK
jgi:hypothetical protein